MDKDLFNSPGYFITGTDTGVGKTTLTLGLMHYLQAHGQRVAAMKPVASGCVNTADGLRNDDALKLQQQASVALTYSQVNPYAFEPAIAPHIAAAANGICIEPGRILQAYSELSGTVDCMLVEGVGGWQVPLEGQYTTADLACGLGLPVILVVGLRLGCLNHARLTADAIAATGLPLAGWVANSPAPLAEARQETINALINIIDGPLLGIVPLLQVVSAEAVAACLRTSPVGHS
ncbi:MAG: dethiobiotin synthase [Gammaproteobacteria bacterium]